MSYKKEFPDFVLDVIIPNGFVDSSWKNDVCPSFFNKKYRIKLFIEYAEYEKRENEDVERFLLVQYSSSDCVPEADDFEFLTDDYSELIEMINVLVNGVLVKH